jgi:hypothetical protein
VSKRITTPWYIVAWVVWLIAFVAYFAMARSISGSSNGPTGGVVAASIVAFIAGIVMLVMWIGALVKLGMQKAWGWFVAVLVLHLVGLGIIGMVAYAIAGPPDTGREVVTRPTPVG